MPDNFNSFSQPYFIYLDGEDITDLVSGSVTITIEQNSIHNSISYKSISKELYLKSNPNIKEGEPRIDVLIDTRLMSFLLEERSGGMTGEADYWGRDITARDNSPWSIKKFTYLDDWKSAKELCEEVMNYSLINWEIDDWLLPNTFDCEGTPVEIVQSVISEIGAIIRANDDGSLTVRYPYPVRPIYLPTIIPVTSNDYYPNLIYDLKYNENVGDHYNRVLILSNTNDKEAPILELEEPERVERFVGDDSYVKVYWFEESPEITHKSIIQDFITDGKISKVERGFSEQTEYVTFSDGIGSTQYPIHSITSISWLGKTGVIDSWNKYSTDIYLDNTEDYRIAEVSYVSEYYRYLLSEHNVMMLIASWGIQSSYTSAIEIITSPIAKDVDGILIDKKGDDITVSYLSNDSVVVRCGDNWIDKNKYNYTTITFESPYRKQTMDGGIIWLDADDIVTGYYHVMRANIILEGAKVANTLEVIRWEV